MSEDRTWLDYLTLISGFSVVSVYLECSVRCAPFLQDSGPLGRAFPWGCLS